tara:strand:+ start:4630 stop:5652 length:1023 start_codon:yes stop_codon:yes gene_type:complete
MPRNLSVVDSLFRLSVASPAPTGAPPKRSKKAIEPYEVIAPTEVHDEHDTDRPDAAALIRDLEQQVQQKNEAQRKCLEQLLQKNRLIERLQREMLEDKRALRDCQEKLASRKREPVYSGTLEEMFRQAEEQIRRERKQQGNPPPYPAPPTEADAPPAGPSRSYQQVHDDDAEREREEAELLDSDGESDHDEPRPEMDGGSDESAEDDREEWKPKPPNSGPASKKGFGARPKARAKAKHRHAAPPKPQFKATELHGLLARRLNAGINRAYAILPALKKANLYGEFRDIYEDLCVRAKELLERKEEHAYIATLFALRERQEEAVRAMLNAGYDKLPKHVYRR